MRSPRLFSFLGNQSNRPSQGRAKQTCSSTGSTIMTTAVEGSFRKDVRPSQGSPGCLSLRRYLAQAMQQTSQKKLSSVFGTLYLLRWVRLLSSETEKALSLTHIVQENRVKIGSYAYVLNPPANG